MLRLVLSLGMALGFFSGVGISETKSIKASAKVLRIGGQYRITHIDKLGTDNFRIRFQSEPLTGKHDHLVLISDHVHFSLEEGQVLRLSAEVMEEKATELEVTQVLLFLPNDHGFTPVWLLSSQFVTRDFHGARWLEMHAPQSDFLIL